VPDGTGRILSQPVLCGHAERLLQHPLQGAALPSPRGAIDDRAGIGGPAEDFPHTDDVRSLAAAQERGTGRFQLLPFAARRLDGCAAPRRCGPAPWRMRG